MLPRKQDALKSVPCVSGGLTLMCLGLMIASCNLCGPFITIDEPMLVSLLTEFHSLHEGSFFICTFYVFGQMYNDMYSPS